MRKYRRPPRFFSRFIPILAASYLLLFSLIQLNTYTNAAFNDVEKVRASVQVSWPIDEWDKSSLSFNFAGLERGGSCDPPYVFTDVYNAGEDMTFSTWKWELFMVGEGKDSKNPISPVLESGEVPQITANKAGRIETSNLQSLPGNGQYRFKITKPAHPGKEAIWSDVIKVSDCSVPEINNDNEKNEIDRDAGPSEQNNDAPLTIEQEKENDKQKQATNDPLDSSDNEEKEFDEKSVQIDPSNQPSSDPENNEPVDSGD
ncbi:amyloid fiber anchoring/assembly protein TapA [Mesobacillus boroniphilus]|uniref:Amyloid fiber anchoring/assembly protein TapA n=1 Tax=Mesobacillus boroniphilus TaxID=308892 RepID=A0A944CPR0_9BACI|nr:amyloid fiber anchoring/assembly protein TapA [Mesobacillus boroniphilus]MBS8266600.1 amyloid fiber anchoring/assembly protein TapA [Mesobacillus boroniphilus]